MALPQRQPAFLALALELPPGLLGSEPPDRGSTGGEESSVDSGSVLTVAAGTFCKFSSNYFF